MKIRIYTIIILLMITIISGGCKKYLDAKPDQSLVIISNLNDLQSILDNYQKINVATLASDIVSGDDYYLTYMDYQAMALQQYRNMYTWQPSDLFDKYTSSVNDWGQVYNCIYLANTVLKNISNVDRTTGNASEWDNIKGQALFLRAYSLYKAATVWSLAYDDKTSNHDLGLPLRLDPDFNTQSVRSTVAETYKQILSDAQTAADLLPISPLHVTRSAKPAAYALLAKVYLAMRNYEIAGINADKCLKINNILIDYNTLNPSAAYPMSQFNKETIYYTVTGGITGTPVSYIYARTDTTLYKLYDINDLRKSVFFNKNTDGTIFFRGSYSGSSIDFNGIATDEIFLIRAECYARNGKIDMALSDLNTLLTNRYKKGTLMPVTSSNNSDILNLILNERRKELLMRGMRWMDIKRLNKEGAEISLKRNLNGQTFSLPSNDLRYALPIPDDIISLSQMPQNQGNMKLNKIILTFIFLMFFLSFGYAQIKPLKIGDTCPDELIKYLSTKGGAIRGKAILLDFWATWCVPCIEAVPLLDTLQLKYKDKLDIISVTGDKEQLVNEVLGKIFKDKRYSIKVLTENKTLNLYFPYQSIPHYVWIDNKGVIKAITSNKESLKFGMDEFLKNQQLGLQMKQDILKYDGKTPLYGKQIALEGKEVIYHSLIAKYRADLPSKFTRGSYFITCINSPIVRLFQTAYGKFDLQYWDPNRTIVKGVETSIDSASLGIFTSSKLIELFKKSKEQNVFTYELMIPDSSYTNNEMFAIMQEDLNRFFRAKGLEGHLEKRTRKVLGLQVIDKNKFRAACVGSGTPNIYNTGTSFKITRQPVSYFLSQMMPYIEGEGVPVVNSTNYKGRLTLELNGNLHDLETLNKQLQLYGLKFIKKKEKIDMVVISKNRK